MSYLTDAQTPTGGAALRRIAWLIILVSCALLVAQAARAVGSGGARQHKGDVNGDGVVDTGDAYLISQAVAGNLVIPERLGDVDEDKAITEIDAMRLLRYHHREHAIVEPDHFLPDEQNGKSGSGSPQIEYLLPNHGLPGDLIRVQGVRLLDRFMRKNTDRINLALREDPSLLTWAQATLEVRFPGGARAPIVAARVEADCGLGHGLYEHTKDCLKGKNGLRAVFTDVLEVLVPQGTTSGPVTVFDGKCESVGMRFIAGPIGSDPARVALSSEDPDLASITSSDPVDPADAASWIEIGIVTLEVLPGAATQSDLTGLTIDIVGDVDTTQDLSGAPGFIPFHTLTLTGAGPGDRIRLGVWVRIPPETGAGIAGTDFYLWFDPKSLDFVSLHQGSYDFGFDYVPGTCIDVTYGRVSGARYDRATR